MFPTVINNKKGEGEIEMRRISRSEPYKNMETAEEEEVIQSWLPDHGTLRERVFSFFDDSGSCTLARIFAFWIMLLIFWSTTVFIIESVRDIKSSLPEEFWSFSELFCVLWFTLEYGMRILTTEKRLTFFFRPLNLIDFFAIAPFYFTLFLSMEGSSASFLRVLRLMRIFRVFKMSKYSTGMKLLGSTMSKSFHTLLLLSVYLAIAIVVFSSMIYFAEMGSPVMTDDGEIYVRPGETNPSPFSSIPASFWWCIVTITTVGYGDAYPTTPTGKLIAAVTMLCGILVLALPINVVGGNFVEAYTISRKSEEIEKSCPEFHHSRERADFYQQKCAELLAGIENIESTLDELKGTLAELRAAETK